MTDIALCEPDAVLNCVHFSLNMGPIVELPLTDPNVSAVSCILTSLRVPLEAVTILVIPRTDPYDGFSPFNIDLLVRLCGAISACHECGTKLRLRLWELDLRDDKDGAAQLPVGWLAGGRNGRILRSRTAGSADD